MPPKDPPKESSTTTHQEPHLHTNYSMQAVVEYQPLEQRVSVLQHRRKGQMQMLLAVPHLMLAGHADCAVDKRRPCLHPRMHSQCRMPHAACQHRCRALLCYHYYGASCNNALRGKGKSCNRARLHAVSDVVMQGRCALQSTTTVHTSLPAGAATLNVPRQP